KPKPQVQQVPDIPTMVCTPSKPNYKPTIPTEKISCDIKPKPKMVIPDIPTIYSVPKNQPTISIQSKPHELKANPKPDVTTSLFDSSKKSAIQVAPKGITPKQRFFIQPEIATLSFKPIINNMPIQLQPEIPTIEIDSSKKSVIQVAPKAITPKQGFF